MEREKFSGMGSTGGFTGAFERPDIDAVGQGR